MNCVFCSIVSKKIPAHIVYEDEHFLGFLDIRPRSPGHTLIIPKKHSRFVWDVEPHSLYWLVAQKIARAQRKAFGTESIWSKVEGEEVPHAHIWIFPHTGTSGDAKDFEGNKEKLIGALSSLSAENSS